MKYDKNATTLPFINRKKEQKFLLDYFQNIPKNILFLYGPKSTGKTTLINKVLEQLDPEIFSVSFLSMRGKLITSFQDFKSVFFPATLRGKIKTIASGISINTGFFGLNVDDEKLLNEDVFALMIKKFHDAKKEGKKPVIIIDEFQYLKDIPLDERNNLTLVQELWKLFIEITKVYNLAHVVCLTSDSYYMEELYMDAKLSNTSDFQLIDHLEKEDVLYWLKETENCPSEMAEEIWENLGGSVWEIWQVFVAYKNTGDWKPKMEDLLETKYSIIMDHLLNGRMGEWKQTFFRVAKAIAETGEYILQMKPEDEIMPLIKLLVDQDVWFYDMKKTKITANSKSFQKAMEKLVRVYFENSK